MSSFTAASATASLLSASSAASSASTSPSNAMCQRLSISTAAARTEGERSASPRRIADARSAMDTDATGTFEVSARYATLRTSSAASLVLSTTCGMVWSEMASEPKMALRTCGDREWLGRVASGEVVLGVGATEAIGAREGAGLTLSGDKVSGRASFVMGGEAATHFLLTTGDQLLIVERASAGVQEVALTTIDKTRHAMNLDLEGATAHLVAGNNHGEAQSKMIDTGRVLLAADTLGAASRMLEKAVDYSKDREQFNRPIASFQAVKHMCAEMAAKLEPCRSLVWYAAYAQDHVPEEAGLTSRLAKAHLSEVGKFVARTATEVHGGMGFTDLLGLHYWFKRIGANRQWLGGPQAVREEAAKLQGWVA